MSMMSGVDDKAYKLNDLLLQGDSAGQAQTRAVLAGERQRERRGSGGRRPNAHHAVARRAHNVVLVHRKHFYSAIRDYVLNRKSLSNELLKKLKKKKFMS